jgi:hypothetical protein
VDEIEKEKHLQANYLEFLEMTCKCIDQASFAKPKEEDDDEDNERPGVDDILNTEGSREETTTKRGSISGKRRSSITNTNFSEVGFGGDVQERREQHLAQKIENVIPMLMASCKKNF